MSRIVLLFFLLWTLPGPCASALAWEPGRLGTTSTPGLHLYQKDFFRILYRTEGRHAVPRADTDKNGVPEYVEDAAKQLWAADQVFCRLYGFRRPLGSTRYPDARWINVWILHREKLKGFLGVAFEAADGPADAPRSLTIFLSNALDFRTNATPVHEYFHLIENASNGFRNRWYYEGLARWSENALFQRRLFAEERWSLSAILASPIAKKFLLASSYDAARHFWNPLSLRCPGDPALPLAPDDPLIGLTYSDGSPVLRDRVFPGTAVVRQLMELLATGEQPSPARAGDDGRSYANNPRLLHAVREAMATPGICRKDGAPEKVAPQRRR